MSQEPNSVLVSLRELRRVEEQRVAAEKDSAQKALDDQRARQEAEARRIKEEEERRKRDEEERVRREQEDRERREREERLRLEEAERRARIEKEMKLEETRIRSEAEARALAKKIPWVPIGTVIGILVIAAVGLGYYSWKKGEDERQLQAALTAQQQKMAELEQAWQKEKAAFDKEQKELASKASALEDQLKGAKDEGQRQAIRRMMQEQAEKERALRDRRNEAERRTREGRRKVNVNASDDPLGGL